MTAAADDLPAVAATAARLQNGYALAIDTRNWDHFKTLFTPDVLAIYPNATYEGMTAWLDSFVPFHAGCRWTQHTMSTHVAGADDHGFWAACYGSIRWAREDEPGRMNRTEVLYRDRLERHGPGWRIARRRLDLVLCQMSVPVPASVTFPHSILDFADMS